MNADLSPESQLPQDGNQEQPKKNKFLQKILDRSSVFVSLLIHGLLLLLTGGLVLVPGYIEKTTFVAHSLPPITDMEEPPPDMEEMSLEDPGGGGGDSSVPVENVGTDVVSDSELVLNDFIASTAPTSMSLPSSTGPVAGTSLGMGSGPGMGGGSGGGIGGGVGKGRGKGSGSLFGQRIDANNLGVIVDSSGTMGKYIAPVIVEVMKNFPKAIVIFHDGMGMEKSVTANFVQTYSPEMKHAGIDRMPPELKDDFKKFAELPNIMFYTGGNGPYTVQYSFHHLIDIHNVDAIYVFSDFVDRINDGLYKEVADKLEMKGIRLFVHSSTGNFGKHDARFRDTVQKTFGAVIEKQLEYTPPSGSSKDKDDDKNEKVDKKSKKK